MYEFTRIQTMLDMKGVNMREMCDYIGASSGNVSDWKSGRSHPTVDKYVKMADYFGTTVDYLTGREEMPKASTPDAQELLRIFNDADREGKTMILAAAFKEKRRMQEIGGTNL